MLNYEQFYGELQPVEKQLKDQAGLINRLQKSIQKDTDMGNLTNMKKSLDTLADAAVQLKKTIDELGTIVQGFDTQAYFAEGDFAKQLLDSCEQKGIDVRGERGIYEMFPYKVRIVGDEEHDGEVYINRKKLPSFRPSYVADYIKVNQEKLYKAKFNATSFMNELSDAYETACLKSGSRIGSTQKLDRVYKAMAPTSRARKEYDKQAFAFDLARIYEAGPDTWVTKAGKQFYFGTSRDGKSGYRVLGSTGVETFVNTIKPLNEEE